MKLITDEYQSLLRQKHIAKPWGGSGKSWIPTLEKFVFSHTRIGSALDFGCGRHTFKEAMGELHPTVAVSEYDPGVPGFDALPGGQFDLVVCTDVMEHVEDKFTVDTLELIRALTRKVVLFNIVTTPCRSTLPDGRNTHINLKKSDEWIRILGEVFGFGLPEHYSPFSCTLIESGSRVVCVLWRRGGAS